MSASAGCRILGRWRIVQADLWDRAYLDLVQPAYFDIGKDGHGEFAFGAMEATIELEYAPRIAFFTWTGFDEGDGRRYSRNRTGFPQRRRRRPDSAPILTFSAAR